MKEAIIGNLGNPRQLEKLYRDDKTGFRRAFNEIYPDIKDNQTAQIWHERLNFENEAITWGTRNELTFILVATFIVGLVANIPLFTGISQDFFFPRNMSLLVFPFLSAYFLWKQKAQTNKLVAVLLITFVSALYINLLPNNSKSDTLVLACIHLPIFLWVVLGSTFVGDKLKDYQKWLDFLRYNGDLIVMTTIILIAGAILSGITIGLFRLIDVNVKEFYFQYFVVWGVVASPVVGTYLVQTNPQLVSKVAPVVAKVFTPLVFVMLVIYLAAVIATGKDPYNDREFLLIFNLLLIGVMAIILFSIAETPGNAGGNTGKLLLTGLSIVTILVNGIALSAILFRITAWGITPNRLAVLGSNMLILSNLLAVTYRLFKSIKNSDETAGVEKSIALFLPVYCLWAVIVTFVFPIVFHFA